MFEKRRELPAIAVCGFLVMLVVEVEVVVVLLILVVAVVVVVVVAIVVLVVEVVVVINACDSRDGSTNTRSRGDSNTRD